MIKTGSREFSQDQENAAENIKNIKHIFIVISGKGGVGKTSVAVNTAYTLADMNCGTGILDIDLHGPNVAKMLGIEQEHLTSVDDTMQPYQIQ